MIKNVITINDHGYVNGGSAKVAIDSAIGLSYAGFAVTFFCACGPVDPALEQAGVEVICLDQKDILEDPDRKSAMLRGLWNRTAAGELKQLLSRFDTADTIIHCHGLIKGLSAAVGPVITGSKIPHVFTLHEYFLACPNGGFYDFQKNEICHRRSLGVSCLITHCDARQYAHKVWRVARQGIMWTAGGLPSKLRNIITISRLQEAVLEDYLPESANLYRVANPIDVPRENPADVGTNDVFLFVGRLYPEKGCLQFAEAAKLAGVKAVFVGDGHLREEVLRINPDAEITGWAPMEQVREWLNRSRCLVFPSLWYETFGLVPYEAIARGVPVVTSAVNAATEAIGHGENGYIVDAPLSAESLADALRHMTPEYCAELGANAYQRYWERPSDMPHYVQRLTEVFEQCQQGV